MARYELRVAHLPTEGYRVGYQSLLTEVVAGGVPNIDDSDEANGRTSASEAVGAR